MIQSWPQALVGSRIQLSAVQPNDYPHLKKILNHKPTMQALARYFNRSEWDDEAVLKRYQKFLADREAGRRLFYVIRHLTDGKIVGECGLQNIDLPMCEAEFGIILHESVWGSGLLDEALDLCLRLGFETLGVRRIYLITDVNNQRARRAWEKRGLRFLEDRPNDAVCYEIFAEEWSRPKV